MVSFVAILLPYNLIEAHKITLSINIANVKQLK